MTKHEAAAVLGVSVRTVERLCLAGRLTKGREKAKTRPRVVFDESQVEALKIELESTPGEPFRRLNTDRPKDGIGFRLDPYYVERLAEEGKKRGMSGADYARSLVLGGLENEAAEIVRDEIGKMRRGLADVMYTLLVMKLGCTKREAEKFINQTELAG